MDTENLTPQIPPQPIPPVTNFPKKAVIFGIALIALVSVFVVSAVFYFKNSKPVAKEQVVVQNSLKPNKISFKDVLSPELPLTQNGKNNTQSPIIIYGEFRGADLVFSSINAVTKEQKELTHVPFNKLGKLGKSSNNGTGGVDIKFCPETNKIYMLTGVGIRISEESPAPTQAPPSTYISVKEIDLAGSMRDLNFTSATVPFYEEQTTYYDSNDFILSRDCQKIVWSTTYYKQSEAYKSEIFIADINGGGKKVLQTDKIPLSWSNTDPNVVYLTGGGLFKFNLNTNSISQIKAVPDENVILDISNNDNLIAHQQDYKDGGNTDEEGFITNLAQQSTVPLKAENYSKRKFSPDNSKIAYTDRVCSFNEHGSIKGCVINLHVFDILKKTDKLLSPDVDARFGFLDWLISDSVISLGNRNDLISVHPTDSNELLMTNINDGKITKLASVSAVFLYVGISGK